MKIIYLILLLLLFGCNSKNSQSAEETNTKVLEEEISNNESSVDSTELKNNFYHKCKGAIQNNNKHKLLSIITQGGDLNYLPSQYNDTTLLSLACGKGDLEIVKILIENGADINNWTGEFESYYSPLGASIKNNHRNIISYLMDQNANLNKATLFIQDADTLMADFLLNKGIYISEHYAIDVEWEVSRLEEALMKKDYILAKYLIDKGSNIDFGVIINLKTQKEFDMIKQSGFNFGSVQQQIKESTGEPSVYSILSNRPKERVQLYLDNGFRPLPNTVATLFNDPDALNIVLRHNREVERFIDLDQTHEFHEYLATYLGANSRSIPHHKTTLLGVAVLQNQQEAIRTLLEYGADPNKPDINGNLPSYYASEKNKAEIESLLIETTNDNSR